MYSTLRYRTHSLHGLLNVRQAFPHDSFPIGCNCLPINLDTSPFGVPQLLFTGFPGTFDNRL